MEQLTSDLSVERATSQKLEAERQAVDRQNKDLKAKVAELEAAAKTRAKAQIAALEARIANLEDQLAAEQKYVSWVWHWSS